MKNKSNDISEEQVEERRLSLKEKLIGIKEIAKATTGYDQASSEEIERRFEICLKCPKLVIKTKNSSGKKTFKCGQCGCFLGYKIRINSQKCPLSKW